MWRRNNTLHCFSSVIFNKPIYLFVCIPSLRWKWLTPFLLLKPLYSSKIFCSHVCVCPCVGVCTCDGYTHTHSHTFYENPVSSGLKHIHISCSVNRPLYFIMHFFFLLLHLLGSVFTMCTHVLSWVTLGRTTHPFITERKVYFFTFSL